MRDASECDICGSKLNEDGTCPSCDAQLELEGLIGRQELEAGFAHVIGQPGPVPLAAQPRATTYLAFDIEIAREIPEGAADWKAYRPFGITCAATLPSDGEATLWHGATADGGLADRMSRDEAIRLVRYLEAEAASGKIILTWNGAGFDFDVLGEESGLPEACARLAHRHIDMMFHFFCLTGFALGLDKAAKGMGLSGKTAGMSGAEAPRLWRQGRRQEVLRYVRQDVVTTLEVCRAVERSRSLQWTSQAGYLRSASFPGGWLTVAQALQLPLPNTAGMRNPWPRSKFTGWMAPHLR